MHVYVYISVDHTCIYVCVCIYDPFVEPLVGIDRLYMYICMYVCIHVQVYKLCIHIYIYDLPTYIHIYIYKSMYVYICR